MRISIRNSILLVLLCMVFISSAMLITIFYYNGSISVNVILKDLMRNISAHMADKCINYLHTAETASRLSKHLAASEIVKTQNDKVLLEYFQQLLYVNEQFAMVYFGDEKGNFIMSKRMPDGTLSTKIVKRTQIKAVSTWYHKNEKWALQFPNEVESPDKAFDPRTRPWYVEAQKTQDMSWTDVYLFYSDQNPGISCSTPIFDKDKQLIGVVGIDISISGLSYFLGNLRIGRNGKAFILNQNHEIIGLPAKDANDIQKISHKYKKNGEVQYRFCSIEESTDSSLRKFFEAFKEVVENNTEYKNAFDKILKKTSSSFKTKYESLIVKADEFLSEKLISVSFVYEGQNYIAMYAPFAEDMGWNWKIVIISPENDFMSLVYVTNNISFAVAGFCIFIAFLVSIYFSSRLSLSLKKLEQEMNKVKDFKLEVNSGLRSRIAEVDRMAIAFEKMKAGLRSFEKYVPADLVRNLVASNTEAALGGEKREISIFFSDVAGFTSIAEKMCAEKLLEDLREYLGKSSDIIHQYKGTVDKYIGDAIMAFWGAPNHIDDHAILACYAALLSKSSIEHMSSEWEKQGKPKWKERIGINTGEAIVGNMGCDNRMDYTVIGDCVNLASRLEGLNKLYGTDIIIGHRTYELAKKEIAARLLDFVIVKGKSEGVAIYELVSIAETASDKQQGIIDNFTDAVLFYRDRNWEKAIKKLENVLRIDSLDIPGKIFMERCTFFKDNPPDSSWNGVFTWNQKK